MPERKYPERKLKKLTLQILARDNWEKEIESLVASERGRLISPLFSSLYNKSEIVKWRGASAFGILAKKLAENEIDKAREILRKCVWTLTEESGGIAWGAPETMGEIMANDKRLLQGFLHLLVSYADDKPEGPENYLEFTPLRKGVYWGIMRIAQEFPEEITKYSDFLEKMFDEESDPEIAACLIITFKLLDKKIPEAAEERCKNDNRQINLFYNRQLQEITVASAASMVD